MDKRSRGIWLRFDRILSQDLLRQVLILLVILAVVFISSFVLLSLSGGDWIRYCEDKQISKWAFPLYLLIDANAYNSFYGNEHVSRGSAFIAGLIYVAGVVVFTGMLISVMTNMIERRVEDHRNGMIHYLQSGHHIIMGYDEMVPSFISHIFEKDPQAYILILTSVEAKNVYEKLNKTFSKEQLKKVIINFGHRTNPEAYRDICLESSEQVFIVGYHSQPAHDAINVECVDSICQYLNQIDIKQKPSRITCVFRDLDTYAAFKTTEIFSEVSRLGIEFVPYNFYTSWAKQVFVKRKHKDSRNPKDVIEYPAVYGDGIVPDDEKFVHLVFVGTTNFAVAFAMEAAHVLHFPNFHNKGVKTRITFIDLNADKEKDEFITRNRHFFEVQSYRYQDLSVSSSCEKSIIVPPSLFEGEDADFLDIEFEFIKGDIFSSKVQKEISDWAKEHNKSRYLSLFLAMANQRNNFVMGMNMPDEVYDYDIPIFIRQDRSDNFVANLHAADDKEIPYTFINKGKSEVTNRKLRYANIYPFGMNATTYCADNKSLKRAKLINYLYSTMGANNKFKSILELNAIPTDKIWEAANSLWMGDPEDDSKPGLTVSLKWSNLYNSYAIRTKLASLRVMRGLDQDDRSNNTTELSDSEVKELAIVEHNRWNVEKLLMGYRKSHKDEDKYEHKAFEDELKRNRKHFIHHDIRPFDKLEGIKELDMEFSRYIPWIMKMTETEE